MPFENARVATRREFPDPDRAVFAARCQPLAVGAECNAGHPIAMAFERTYLARVCNFPNLRSIIGASRSKPAAIGAERD